MEDAVVGQEKPAWTWADQVSTYRFWGLSMFFLSSAFSLAILTGFLPLLWRETLGLSVAGSVQPA